MMSALKPQWLNCVEFKLIYDKKIIITHQNWYTSTQSQLFSLASDPWAILSIFSARALKNSICSWYWYTEIDFTLNKHPRLTFVLCQNWPLHSSFAQWVPLQADASLYLSRLTPFFAILNSINLTWVLQNQNHRSELHHQKCFLNQVLNTA